MSSETRSQDAQAPEQDSEWDEVYSDANFGYVEEGEIRKLGFGDGLDEERGRADLLAVDHSEPAAYIAVTKDVDSYNPATLRKKEERAEERLENAKQFFRNHGYDFEGDCILEITDTQRAMLELAGN